MDAVVDNQGNVITTSANIELKYETNIEESQSDEKLASMQISNDKT